MTSYTLLSEVPIRGDFPGPLAGEPVGVRSKCMTGGDGKGEHVLGRGVGMGVVESIIWALGLLEK